MHPMAARSNRSSLHHSRSSPIPTSSISSSVYHQQQQQQQILYAPISNPIVTYQPCGTALHSSCVYPSVQPHNIGSPNSVPLHLQGKNNRWHSRNKQSSRNQQYYQQQQQLSYTPKPPVLFDQSTGSVGPIPQPSTASLLVSTSTFAHGPLTSEHYSNTGGVPAHLLPQSYFKPPDGLHQTFCLIQDRQNTQQPHQHQQQQHNHPLQASYYNISATNTCSLQTVNANTAFPLTNFAPYSGLATFTNNQLPSTSAQSSALFSSPPVSLVFAATTHDKALPLPATSLEFSSFKHNTSKISSVCESRVVRSLGHDENPDDWPSQLETFSKNSYDAAQANNNKNLESADCPLRKVTTAVAKTDEEHFSDESSTSFDFTIEAEKMVSALCNTTSSNDLGKEESKPGKTAESAPLLFNGAGDNVPNKNTWFADCCPAYESGTSIGVQTDDGPTRVDRSQYPELIRKTAYWGCTEAEIVLEGSRADLKRDWLARLSSATRTAITKSTTCIPVFAGDRVFADDLISALLRVSNGWLSLDNYLNKQHFPNLLDRLDPEFIACFHAWEESTCELLKEIARAFRKFGENRGTTINDAGEQRRKETCARSSSFPGDVSLYATCDLFAPVSASFSERDAIGKDSTSRECASSANDPRELQCNFGQQEEQQSTSHKESKLRSRWTITGNLSSLISSTRSDVTACRTTDVNGPADNNKLRTRDTSSCRQLDSTRRSLNAEFCQLRSKVMKSNADTRKDRKRDYASENKLPVFVGNAAESVRSQNPTTNAPVSYEGLYAQNSKSLSFLLPGQSDSPYPAANPGILTYGGSSYSSSTPYPAITDLRGGKDLESMYDINKGANANPIYVGGSQADQIELPTVPRNKVTLLSQIEPRTFDKESEEMAANLSAWFASMRNAQLPTSASTLVAPRLSFAQQETSRYSTGAACKQAQQHDANRQYQALQNLPNIQSTPWAAAGGGSLAANRPQARYAPDEYDSSEDVRVYMKPGSYNVPKKRYQRRPNRRAENNAISSRNLHTVNRQRNVACGNRTKSASVPASSTPLSHANAPTCLTANVGNATLIKTSFPPASQLPTPQFDLETFSPRESPERAESQDARRDVTWKAACASAEILLEALNIKDYADASQKVDRDDDVIEEDGKNEDNAEALPATSRQSDTKSRKHEDVDCVSSYEASEDDDSGATTCRLSPNTNVAFQSRENENALSLKTNVKTDFWLIRTLNNASITGEQKRLCKDDDVNRPSSESSNSSIIADVKADHRASSASIVDVDAKNPVTTIIDVEYPAIFPLSRESASGFSSRNDNTLAKESEIRAGRATYSETVRRSMRPDNTGRKEAYKSGATDLSMNSNVTGVISGRRCQRKDPEQSYQLLHKLQKSAVKKVTKNVNDNDLQLGESSCAKVSGDKPNDATPKSSTKIHGKTKDLECPERKRASKSADRGWSVWYSSRKKQCLSPLTFGKLETIHRTVWQMDEADALKCPLSRDEKNNRSPPAGMVGDYRKFVKSPVFFEIVDYKMKNRAYHRVEHAVKDFRRIIHDAKSCHQHDDERARKIEALSKKLEELLQEHFGNGELDNIATRENSPVQPRFKTSGQKSIATRCDNTTRKGVSPSVVAENCSFH